MKAVCDFRDKHCQACEGGVPPMSSADIETALKAVPGWSFSPKKNALKREFVFKGFLKTMSFVNAVAWIANAEGHHPELKVNFDRCTVYYQTHAVAGVTENDFICAAKINALSA